MSQVKEEAMKRELTCVTCPQSCRLLAEGGSREELVVTGNRCKRGLAYALEEIFDPKRVVTATMSIAPDSRVARAAVVDLPQRLPCRTRTAFPRERIPELLALIARSEARLPLRGGEVLLPDLLGSGIDLIATRSLP